VFPEKKVYPFHYALANHELGTIWFRATIPDATIALVSRSDLTQAGPPSSGGRGEELTGPFAKIRYAVLMK